MLQLKTIISLSNFHSMLDVRCTSSNPCTTKVVEHKEKVISEDGDLLFCNKYSDGTYTFGLVQGDRMAFGHTKGYVWSSRASVVNKYFGTNLIEVGIYYADSESAISRAIDVDILKCLLPEDFHVVKGQYDSGEEYYAVELVSDRKTKCMEVLYNRGENVSNTPVYNMTTILLNRNTNN